MSDPLTAQLHQLGFAVITGLTRLTPSQREALADLNAAVAQADRAWANIEGTDPRGNQPRPVA